MEVDELENLFSSKGLHSTREELASVVQEMQLELTSHIDYEEFCQIMHRLRYARCMDTAAPISCQARRARPR